MAQRVLGHGNIKVAGKPVTVSPYNPIPEVQDTILVTGIPGNIEQDMIEMYFESTKRSGGGKIAKIVTNFPKEEAVITFEDAAGWCQKFCK